MLSNVLFSLRNWLCITKFDHSLNSGWKYPCTFKMSILDMHKIYSFHIRQVYEILNIENAPFWKLHIFQLLVFNINRLFGSTTFCMRRFGILRLQMVNRIDNHNFLLMFFDLGYAHMQMYTWRWRVRHAHTPKKEETKYFLYQVLFSNVLFSSPAVA